MNKTLKCLLALSMLTSAVAFYADCCSNGSCGTCSTDNCGGCCDCDCSYLGKCDGYPFLQPRSQGFDAARWLAGTEQFMNRYGADSTNGFFSTTVEYSQSFRNERLTHFLFGNQLANCCNLLVQGSRVTGRNANAWLAEYFGLPSDYSSKISFCPKIQNAIVDLDLYLGLDGWAEGLYMRFDLPIAWTKWQLCPCETICNSGENPIPAGYMSTATISRDDLPTSFLQVMKGCSAYGDMQSPIKYGRISNCACTEAGVAQFNYRLGWNFHLEEDHYFGMFLYAAAPTGNRPCATNLFEPMLGNGKHWELGGGLSGSWIFWRSSENDSRYVGFWLDATVAHLFKTCQCRSFDFKCKPNSRYMLLEQLTTTDGSLTGTGLTYTPSTYQYAGNLIPAINWSTFQVEVSIPVQADIAIKLCGVRENWSFDLGYDFWARSGEKFCNDCCNSCCTDSCSSCSGTVYAIKGDAQLYAKTTSGTVYPIAQTESAATISCAAAIDNAELAFHTNVADHQILYTLTNPSEVQTSIQPVLATKSMLNLGKSPASITNKIFANISYAWKDREGSCVPFLGIGGNVEFSMDYYKDCCCCDCSCDSCNSCNTCNTCNTCSTTCSTTCASTCNSCNSCGCCPPKGAVSLWGVWVKGGVAFD